MLELNSEIKALEDVISEFELDDVLQRTASGVVASEVEQARLLADLLFGITAKLPSNKLVEVRDFDAIKEWGAFKYSGQLDTMRAEGLVPDDVFDELKALGLDRHVGPAYLRVKGLLTHHRIRSFFGAQMAHRIARYLNENPLDGNDEGYVVCIPNMTGGAWIGDATARSLEDVMANLASSNSFDALRGIKVWPATPYARETRKPIEATSKDQRLVDYVEGIMPTPEETRAIFVFEELRTACETSQNATNIYRHFGYGNARIVEACVFDYRHPVGMERLNRLGVDGLYLVGGEAFFATSKVEGHIRDSQYATGMHWLSNPWDFTRKILPDLKRLASK